MAETGRTLEPEPATVRRPFRGHPTVRLLAFVLTGGALVLAAPKIAAAASGERVTLTAGQLSSVIILAGLATLVVATFFYAASVLVLMAEDVAWSRRRS